jgi:hypothetical protein
MIATFTSLGLSARNKEMTELPPDRNIPSFILTMDRQYDRSVYIALGLSVRNKE